MLDRKHSEQTLIKFKQRVGLSGEDNHMFGKSWSPELREKILNSRIGQKRTEEFKENQRQNAKKLNLKQYFLGKTDKKVIDDLGIVYKSLAECAKINEISVQTVCDILKGRHNKTRKGRSFEYYDS